MSEIPQGGAAIILAEAGLWLNKQPDHLYDFVYIDPPFNTGRAQVGASGMTFPDRFGARYIDGFLRPVCSELWRVLGPTGSMIVHVDQHESHYVKVMLDSICGRDHFANEIIWAYDYGGRSKKKWPKKHDTLFWYVRDTSRYVYNYEQIDRIPYMAPGLVGPEKAARGKTPTDVWFHTICPTSGPERVGYPTQKPLGILRRILRVHTTPGAKILDTFAGSGTTGVAAVELCRSVTLVDESGDAIRTCKARLSRAGVGAWSRLGDYPEGTAWCGAY